MDEERWVVLRAPTFTDNGDVRRMTPDQAAQTELQAVDIPASAVADLERDPRTLAAAPDMPTALIRPTAGDNLESMAGHHPIAGDAWGIAAVGANLSRFDGAGVRVAVLDTGVDAGHPAFAGIRIERKDFTGHGVDDRNGHGTHCAGTVLGRGMGVRIGIATGVTEFLSGKVLDDAGRGSILGVLRGLQWAARLGANVVSLSLGFDVPGFVVKLMADGVPQEPAISKALESYRKNFLLFDAQMLLLRRQSDIEGAPLVIAASGNESRRSGKPAFTIAAGLPAAAEGIVCVGALEHTPSGLSVAKFSNTLPKLSAPGVGVVSAALGGGLVALSGTSMACPHVAGVAALWWQYLGAEASAEAVLFRLRAAATFDGLSLGYSHTDVGWGLVRSP